MVLFSSLAELTPFKIDALGLVTILGRESMDESFGTLAL